MPPLASKLRWLALPFVETTVELAARMSDRNSVSTMERFPQTPRLPRLFRLAGHVLRHGPARISCAMLTRTASSISARHPQLLQRLAPFDGKVMTIVIEDAGVALNLRLGSPIVLTLTNRGRHGYGDAVVSGNWLALVAMLEGRVDGDALFFSRVLSLQPDVGKDHGIGPQRRGGVDRAPPRTDIAGPGIGVDRDVGLAVMPMREVDAGGRFLGAEVQSWKVAGIGLVAEPATYGGVGPRLDLSEPYLVVMQHPMTTEHRDARRHVEETLLAVLETDMPTLWFWPNVDAGSALTARGLRIGREELAPRNIHFFKNLPPEEFIRVVDHSACIVGNSSVAIRECAYLGVPAVNIGTRQSGRDRGRNVLDVGYDRRDIHAGIKRQVANGRQASDPIYGDGAAGGRISEVLATAKLDTVKRLAYWFRAIMALQSM